MTASVLDRFLLGPERVLWAADQVAPLNFCVVVDVSGPLTVGALRIGLAAAQRRHGALRCGVRVVEGVPHFRPVSEPIPLSIVAGVSGREHLSGELDTPFDAERGPLLRVRWVRGAETNTLLFTFHHAVADGRSGMVLAQEVLASAAAHLAGRVSQQRPTPVIVLPDPVPVSVVPMPPTPRVVDAGEGPAGRQTMVCTHRFSVEDTRSLRRAARRLGATVHGLLCATHLAAVAAEHGRSVPLVLSCPADLRSAYAGAEKAIGVLLGNWLQAYRVDPQRGVSSLAKRISADIRRALERGLGWPSDDGPVDLVALYDARASTAVSNLGVLDFEDVGVPLQVTGIYFVVACSALGDQIVTATTYADRLTWSLCASTPTFSPDRIRRVAAGSLERLLQLRSR